MAGEVQGRRAQLSPAEPKAVGTTPAGVPGAVWSTAILKRSKPIKNPPGKGQEDGVEGNIAR